MSAAREQMLKVARVGTLAVGRVTQGARMDPTFLIVGAQRCGTTSMFKVLRQHPAVLAPALQKGIHYFDKNYPLGPGWYRQDLSRRGRRRGCAAAQRRAAHCADAPGGRSG